MIKISSFDTPNGRFYHVPMQGIDGYTDDYVSIYPSVTTVLSRLTKKDIEAWRDSIGHAEADKIKWQACKKGTLFHGLLEKHVRKEPIDRTQENPIVLQEFDMISPILDKYLTNVRIVEEALWSRRLHTAGRVDVIGDWNGVPMVVDFKTARKAKKRKEIVTYFMQATCYAMMYNEGCYEGPKIQDFVIVMSVAHDLPKLFYGKVETYKPWVEKLFIEERLV